MLTDFFTQGGALLREQIEADLVAGKVVTQLETQREQGG